MIYPIVIYGSPVLRKKSVDIEPDYPELKKLIDDMYLTLAPGSRNHNHGQCLCPWGGQRTFSSGGPGLRLSWGPLFLEYPLSPAG